MIGLMMKAARAVTLDELRNLSFDETPYTEPSRQRRRRASRRRQRGFEHVIALTVITAVVVAAFTIYVLSFTAWWITNLAIAVVKTARGESATRDHSDIRRDEIISEAERVGRETQPGEPPIDLAVWSLGEKRWNKLRKDWNCPATSMSRFAPTTT